MSFTPKKDTLTDFLAGKRDALPAKLETVAFCLMKHCDDNIKNPSANESEVLDMIRVSLPTLCQQVLRDEMTVDKFIDLVVKTAQFYSIIDNYRDPYNAQRDG